MASFEWLNDIPEEDWERLNEGWSKTYDRNWFLEQCRIKDDEEWPVHFDQWANTQARGYEHRRKPGNIIEVLWGDWEITPP